MTASGAWRRRLRCPPSPPDSSHSGGGLFASRRPPRTVPAARPLRVPGRRSPARGALLAALGLLVLLAAWVGPGDAKAQIVVPSDWSMKPAAVPPGGKFRLMFITTGKINGSSAAVSDYDAVVHSDVDGNVTLKPYKAQFRALVSTPTVNARQHVGMVGAGTGIKVFWVGGAKIADNYSGVWNETWQNEALSDIRNEHGANFTLALPVPHKSRWAYNAAYHGSHCFLGLCYFRERCIGWQISPWPAPVAPILVKSGFGSHRGQIVTS